MYDLSRSLTDFDKLIKKIRDKRIVCYGAGNYFRKFLQTCCIDNKLLQMPDYICDSNQGLHGSKILGVKVHPPERLSQENRGDVFIVITGHHLEVAGLLNTTYACYFFPMLPSWSFEIYLTIKDRIDDYNHIVEMLHDNDSKHQYYSYLNNMLTGAVFMPQIFTPNPYYGNDVIKNFNDGETIVICGAYDGKHIDAARKLNNKLRLHLFEPCAASADSLRKKFMNDDNVNIHQYAVYSKSTRLPFVDTVASLSHVPDASGSRDENITYTVQAVSIDEYLQEKVDFIAMDIEGCEYEAICGATETICKHKPKLAVSAYHKYEDYFILPQLLAEMNPDYNLYFRHHSSYHTESVIYAV